MKKKAVTKRGPGRPIKKASKKVAERISFRVHPKEKKAFEEKAGRVGRKPSSIARELIVDWTKQK